MHQTSFTESITADYIHLLQQPTGVYIQKPDQNNHITIIITI